MFDLVNAATLISLNIHYVQDTLAFLTVFQLLNEILFVYMVKGGWKGVVL